MKNFMVISTRGRVAKDRRGKWRFVYAVHQLHRPSWEGAQFLDSDKAWKFLHAFHERFHSVQLTQEQS